MHCLVPGNIFCFQTLSVMKYIETIFLQAYMFNFYIPHSFMTQESFKTLLHGNGKVGWKFRPTLICFYAHWAKDIHGYLYAFNETVKQYKSDYVRMRYGLMDLSRDWTKKGKVYSLVHVYVIDFALFLFLYISFC